MPECCGVNSPKYVSTCACSILEKKEKHYFVRCPFCDPRDNKVDLYEACNPCYWNNGIITVTKDLIPSAVCCNYAHLNEFIVDVIGE
jgi:hypothetical protein